MLLINKQKGLTMTRSLKDFAQAVCAPRFHDYQPSWDDLLLPVDTVHRCPDPLSLRRVLRNGGASGKLGEKGHTTLTFPGRSDYIRLFPEAVMFDLYQDATKRPRKGSDHWPALTTGCSRMWIEAKQRFAHGRELLLLQGVPVTQQAATLMRSREVCLDGMSHRQMCRLAGNAMHSSCIGVLCLAALTQINGPERRK